MSSVPPLALHQHFADLPDPRVERTKRHQLLDILTIAVCAVISGADSWVDIELYGRAKEAWLRTFLALPNGIPSHDTFSRVFARLDPSAFEARFLTWVQAVMPRTAGEVVAIDGKVLRGSHERGADQDPLTVVSAWAATNRLVLGQVAVEPASNEITAVPALLEVLALEGCLVTLDALHCQTATAQAILDRGADYVLALKRNQPLTHDTVETFFSDAVDTGWRGIAHEQLVTEDVEHGRVETRHYWTSTDARLLDYLSTVQAWPGLTAVGMVTRERWTANGRTCETSYYLMSLAGEVTSFARTVRGYWGIENGQHWILDIAFREDDSRVRTGHSAENFAVLRRIALNLLRQERSVKAGVKAKRLKAGWDEAYLLKLLAQ